jgi:hypothetical protein
VDPVTGRDIFDKSVNVNDYYTRIGIAWDYYGDLGPNLKKWLDPLNSGATSIGGYNPVTNSVPREMVSEPILVYPNPAGDRLYISYSSGFQGPVHISLYNLQGIKVFNRTADLNGAYRINLPGLPSGNYILHIEGASLHESTIINVQ